MFVRFRDSRPKRRQTLTNNLKLTSYKIVKMSNEIDRVARTCVIIECNGIGIILMSGYAASCEG